MTFHRASNYGAVLQAYALQVALSEMGHSSQVIDYRSEFIEEHYRPALLKTLTSARRLGIALLRNGYMRDRRSLFSDFIAREVPTSREVEAGDMAAIGREFDVLVAGSDQVWNSQTAGFDLNYFLDFAPDGVRRISYAASIGVSEIPADAVSDYRRLLSGYDAITMRESTGARALECVLGYRPESVLDPTLLLSRQEWQEAFGYQDEPEARPYVLLYLLAEDKAIVDYARRLAAESGVEVRYISQRLFRPRGVKTLDRVGPEEFVRLFLGASAVVTNSFHGVAFSINFGLNLHFDLLPPPSGVNSRITDVVEALGVADRRIGTELLPPRSAESIEASARFLDVERERSLRLLSEMVKD